MSKELDKFKKDFAPLKKAAEKCQEDYKVHTTNREHHKQMMMESAKEIGRAVQEAKDGGATGDKLADFITDKNVKVVLKTVATADKALNKEEGKLKKILSTSGTTKKSLLDLKKKVEKEVAARKKKKTRKLLPKDSKSLAEMEKLPKEIGDHAQGLEDHIIGMEAILKWAADKEYKGFEKIAAIEIKMTKDERKGRDTGETDNRAFDLRLVQKAHQTVKKMSEGAKKLCIDALKQTKAGDKAAAKTSLDKAYAALKQIEKAKAPYDRSFKTINPYDLKTMKQSADGKKIIAAYTDMGNMQKDAKKAVVGTARKSV